MNTELHIRYSLASNAAPHGKQKKRRRHAGLLLVVGRHTEIELCVPEIIKKWIVSIFGPRLQWQPKLLHEGSRIKLDEKRQIATYSSVLKLNKDIN